MLRLSSLREACALAQIAIDDKVALKMCAETDYVFMREITSQVKVAHDIADLHPMPELEQWVARQKAAYADSLKAWLTSHSIPFTPYIK